MAHDLAGDPDGERAPEATRLFRRPARGGDQPERADQENGRNGEQPVRAEEHLERIARALRQDDAAHTRTGLRREVDRAGQHLRRQKRAGDRQVRGQEHHGARQQAGAETTELARPRRACPRSAPSEKRRQAQAGQQIDGGGETAGDAARHRPCAPRRDRRSDHQRRGGHVVVERAGEREEQRAGGEADGQQVPARHGEIGRAAELAIEQRDARRRREPDEQQRQGPDRLAGIRGVAQPPSGHGAERRIERRAGEREERRLVRVLAAVDDHPVHRAAKARAFQRRRAEVDESLDLREA